MLARPHVKLVDVSRQAVSIATVLQVEQVTPAGPACGGFR